MASDKNYFILLVHGSKHDEEVLQSLKEIDYDEESDELYYWPEELLSCKLNRRQISAAQAEILQALCKRPASIGNILKTTDELRGKWKTCSVNFFEAFTNALKKHSTLFKYIEAERREPSVLILRVDKVIDKRGKIRSAIRKLLDEKSRAENLQDFFDIEEDDSGGGDTDIVAEDEGELPEEFEFSDRKDKEIKETYYPCQIFLANEIVDRIKGIYIHHHNCDQHNALSQFKHFDFYIYTANFNMLQDQTWLRLSKKESGCLPDKYYEGSDSQARIKAKERVFKYNDKTVRDHHRKLKENVKSNPDTLFLIVADEAQWGATTQDNPHYKLINEWNTKEHPNVILLQVTATPYNLLTENTRLQTDIFYKKKDGQFEFKKQQDEYSIHTDGFKQLHRVKWTESFKMKVRDGIVVKLRIPLRGEDKCPAQLYVKPPRANDEFLPWYGLLLTREYPEYTSEFLIQSKDNHIAISTLDNRWTLIARNNKIGFVCNIKESDISKFDMLNYYGEGIFLLMPAEDRTTKHLVYNSANETIQLSSARATVDDDEFTVPDLKSSFLIEESRPLNSLGHTKEYISLNYYFNSMRNEEPTDQLIREDYYFEAMVENITSKRGSNEILKDDILAAEYSYNIILINLFRQFPLKYKTADECLKNFEDCANHIHVKRKGFMDNFKEKLKSTHADIQPIQVKVIEDVLYFLSEKVKEDFERDKKAIRNTKGIKRRQSEELIYSLISCLLHLDIEENRKIGEKLKDLEEQKLLQLYSYAKEYHIDDVLRNIFQESETGKIVDSLIPHDIRKLDGMMTIICTNKKELGNRIYKTICIARKISSKVEYSFEILRDYGSAPLVDHFNDKSPINCNEKWASYRMRKRLQTKRCQTLTTCNCIYEENENISLYKQTMICKKCNHEHKKIEYYEDLEGLPCILILVQKGRLGDTFPKCLRALDLRLKHATKTSAIMLSSVVQEMGRLCRYQIKSPKDSLPYILIGKHLGEILRESLNYGATYFSTLNLPNNLVQPDGKSNRKCLRRKDVLYAISHSISAKRRHVANKNHSDFNNVMKHNNRILLGAEPQIGKTGVYLKVISLLQKHFSLDTSEESEDEYEDDIIDKKEESDEQDEKDDKGKWIYPFWKDIDGKPSISKTITNGKYIPVYGKYQHKISVPEIQPRSLFYHNPNINKSNISVSPVHHFKSYNFNEHSSCTECCFQYESIVVGLCMPKVIDGTERQLDFTISVPKTLQYHRLLNSIKQYAKNEISDLKAIAGTQVYISAIETLKTWVFIPSYNRSRKANVNLYHSMVREDQETQVFSHTTVLVVRKSDFESYCKLWRSTHAILQIPDTLPGAERDVHSGGIGYARLSIQLFAEILELDWIFMLDDSVPYVYEVEESNTTVKRANGCLKEKNVPLFKVLKHMETQVDGSVTEAPEIDYEKYSEKYVPLEDYTGPSENYGIIGLKKFRPTSNKVQTPFKKTHVYSLVLLNIKKMKEKNVYYKPWEVFEDLNFNNDCDDSGLWVIKYNRFTARKINMKTWIPKVYIWTEETVLTKEMEMAENSNNIIIDYLKSECPIECVIRLPKTTIELSDNLVEKFLSSVVQNGKYKMFALDNEQFEKATDELNDMFKDKSSYSNGDNYFVIVISSKLCFNKNMIQKKDIEQWLMNILQNFESQVITNFEFQVITSHNVKFFTVEVILIIVKVKLHHAVPRKLSLSRQTNPKKRPSDESEAPVKLLKVGNKPADMEIDDLQEIRNLCCNMIQGMDKETIQEMLNLGPARLRTLLAPRTSSSNNS